MNILFLTWKDIKHPNKGGAEGVIYEYAKGLAQKGHNVVWFASSYDEALEEENIDGIKIIRKFNINTIYFKAFSWYKEYKKNNQIDLIIDEAGGIPLLSPLFERKIPIIFMIHHIGEKEWDYKFKYPVNIIFKNIFRLIIKLYKNKNTITVSNSTKDELVKDFGFKSENIKIIENALNLKPIDNINFEKKENSILFLGRLTQIKRVEDAILGFAKFSEKNNDFVFNILGVEQEKEYVEGLRDLVKSNNLQDKVIFRGFNKELFFEYLEKSKILLVPSYKEGFGLVVLEGNAYGLPSLGYDVPGLRDSIKDGENGFKVKSGDFDNISKILNEILTDEEKYQELSKKSLNIAKKYYGWGKNIDDLEKYILNVKNNYGK